MTEDENDRPGEEDSPSGLRRSGVKRSLRGKLAGLLGLSFCILHSAFCISSSPAPSAGPDIRTIVPPQPYFLKGSVFWLVVAVASLLLAGLVAWYLLRRPRAPSARPRVSPREAARERLAALAARADDLDARTFGSEACDVLRVYVTDEYRLQPQRQTSPEFLSTVAASRVFSRREHTLLSEFLEGCDGLKFARLETTPSGKRALLDQAGEFLDGRPPETAEPPPFPGVPPPPPPPLPPVPISATGDGHRWQPPAVPPPVPRA